MHVALAGVLAGLLHVVSGPDHLVAVAPLAMKHPWKGLRIGVNWGLGHASGVLLVGAAGVVLRTVVDVDLLSRWAEFIIGFVLIGVGLWAITQMRKVLVHKHPHKHQFAIPTQAVTVSSHAGRLTDSDDGENHQKSHFTTSHEEHGHSSRVEVQKPNIHAHLHVHTEGETRVTVTEKSHSVRGSFLVGLVHGAAGTGHLLGVVPTLSLPPLLGAIYLGSYGTAAVVAMGSFGFLMGVIGNRVEPSMLRRFMLGCGVLAIGLGLFWLQSGWQEIQRSN